MDPPTDSNNQQRGRRTRARPEKKAGEEPPSICGAVTDAKAVGGVTVDEGIRAMQDTPEWKAVKETVEGGIPGLLRGVLHPEKNIVEIVLRRVPVDTDMPVYTKWYMSVYEGFLAIRCPFCLLFDISRVSEIPGMKVCLSKFALTVCLEPRTSFQVMGSAVLMKRPENPALKSFLSILESFMKRRNASAPRTIEFTRDKALAFLEEQLVCRGLTRYTASKARKAAVKTSRKKVKMFLTQLGGD